MSFVYDNTRSPFPKSDKHPLSDSDDPNQNITASEWNAVCQAEIDLRAAIISGNYFGFKSQSQSPNPQMGLSGTSAALWFSSSGDLYLSTTSSAGFTDTKLGNASVTPFISAAAAPYPTPATGSLGYDVTTAQLAVSDGLYWREATIRVAPIPVINLYNPTASFAGTVIQFTGSRFIDIQSALFSASAVTYAIDSTSTGHFTVPSNVGSAPLLIWNLAGTGSAPLFNVLNTLILSSYNTGSGQPGDTVALTGSGFTILSAVAFPLFPSGYVNAASFHVVDDQHATAVIPFTPTTTGSIQVTAGGTATGPNFLINSLWYILTASALPPNIESVISGTSTQLILQKSAVTASTVGPANTLDIYEDFGNGYGGGRWSFFPFKNSLANPNDWSTGWTYSNVQSASNTLEVPGPNGTNTALKLFDTSSTGHSFVQHSGTDLFSVGGNFVSAWFADSTASVPAVIPAGSASAILWPALDSKDNGTIFCYPSQSLPGSQWKRVFASTPSPVYVDDQTATVYLIGGILTGAYGVTANKVNFQMNAATGTIYLWGFQGANVQNIGNDTSWGIALPAAYGQTGGATWGISSSFILNQFVKSASDMAFELSFITDPIYRTGGGNNTTTQTWWLYSFETPNGVIGSNWGASGGTGAISGIFNDSAGGGITAHNIPQNTVIKVFQASSASMGAKWCHVFVNGCQDQASSGGVNASITTPTKFWLGSYKGTASFAPVRHMNFKNSTRTRDSFEGYILGDSLMSNYLPGTDHNSVGYGLYNFSESINRVGIISMAFPGDIIGRYSGSQSQTNKWLSSSQRGRTDLSWMSICIGINDLATFSRSEAQIATDINFLIFDVNNSNPNTEIFLFHLLPTSGTLTPAELTDYDNLQADIAGTGPNPISGSRLNRLPPFTGTYQLGTLNSGLSDEKLLPKYQGATNDDRHQNDRANTEVIIPMLRTALTNKGFL